MNSIVYHYTSPQGAFDILRNKTLWFTDCQYLNDMGEFIYILEPLKEAYKKISQERGENTYEADTFLKSFFESPYEDLDFVDILRRKRQRIKHSFPPKFRYYVLCTSSNADTASMWNYYVKEGAYHGYNLGLDQSVICEWFSHQSNGQIKLVDGAVIYSHKKQVEMIYNKLQTLFNRFDEMMRQIGEDNDDSPAIDEFQDGLFDYINKQKLFFKSPCFESEREFRFVLKVHDDFSCSSNNNLRVNFRVGASGIITPYIEWFFGDLKATLLKQITLSPMMEPELAKAGFKRFLADDVYRTIKIEPSRIKLRF